MTRVEAMMSQFTELTWDERQEFLDRIADQLYPDSDFDPKFIQELNRRVEEFESGKVKGIEAEEVFRSIRAELHARQQTP